MRKEKWDKGFKQSCQKLFYKRYPDTNHPLLLLKPYQVKGKDTARACNFVRMPLMNWIRLWKNLLSTEFCYTVLVHKHTGSKWIILKRKRPHGSKVG